MPPRRKPREPDPLDAVRVEVSAGLGDSMIKAECTLAVAHVVLIRLHEELELMGKIKPELKPVVDQLPSGSTWVPDDDGYGEGDRARKPGKPRLGF
jgi:hypothetical protein